MQDPNELFQFETDTPLQDIQASVLVIALEGFIDAGHTQRLVAEQLLEAHESTVVASFDLDQLLDYRGRRPVMVFDRDHWASYADPSLLLHRVTDQAGVPFLVLAGPEPDYQWERMAEATRSIIEALGVELTVMIHGIPMAVPHTRPLGVTVHGTNPRLITGNEASFGTVQVPGSFASLLEYRLGEVGRDALGFAIHVPHYLSQSEYADAGVLGIQRLASATGLGLDVTALVTVAGDNRAEIDRQLAESDEVAAVVRALEEQYDTFVQGRRQRSLLATDLSDLPTADEIGAEFEAFLQDVGDNKGDKGGETPPPGTAI
ncbi:MAG: PAC2 family protein [Micrococcales bacterium]|nr:PAC2 family protein [Micrococcales bacterium]